VKACRNRRAAVIGLAVLWTLPAGAEACALRDALAGVPAPVLMGGDAVLASFVGLRDLRETEAFKARKPPRLADRLYPAVSSDTLQALLRNDAAKTRANWREKTGLAIADLSSFLIFGAPPNTVTIWRFDGKDGAGSFLEGLASRGFTKSADGGVSNGEPLKMDLSKRDEANPFAGPLGRASMLAPAAGGVAQSSSPRYIAALRAMAAPGFASLPPVAAALDGLEKVAGNALVPQATVLGVGAWTPGVAGMTERNPRILEGGAPPAAVAIVADVETAAPARRGAVFAIGYPDCDTAAKASARFARSWREDADGGGKTPRERTGAEPVTQEVAGDKSCAAVISLTVPAGKEAGNQVYGYILNALVRRDFKAIQGR